MIEVLVIYPDQGERLLQFDREEITIGRRPENDLVLPVSSVSSRHARIFWKQDQLWLEDLRSTNGTQVNDRDVVGMVPLSYDDLVAIDTFKLQLRPPSDPTWPGFEGYELPGQAAWDQSVSVPAEPAFGASSSVLPPGLEALLDLDESVLKNNGATLAGYPVGERSLLARSGVFAPDHAQLEAAARALGPESLYDPGAMVEAGSRAGVSGSGSRSGGANSHDASSSLLAQAPGLLDGHTPPGGSGGARNTLESPRNTLESPRNTLESPRNAAPVPHLSQGSSHSSHGSPHSSQGSPHSSQGSPHSSQGSLHSVVGSPASSAGSPASSAGSPAAAIQSPPKATPAAQHRPTIPAAEMPRLPQSIEETGLKRGHLVDLILKTVYFAGEISGYDLATELRLPFGQVLEPLIQELRRDKSIEVKGGGSNFGSISMIFSCTSKATEQVHQILDRNRYIGPAPVPMDTYVKMVKAQSMRGGRVVRRQLLEAFSHLTLDDELYDDLGPAMNSGMAMLLYGHPGNGKSAICQTMIRCFDDAVFVPYAIEVDGNIIKLFDEHTHKPIVQPARDRSEVGYDQRFVLCHRPLIMVGGELTLDMLDMHYSSEARFYEAPFQMKANGGILLIDDLGRQKVSPRELLNRWIVPLESEVDIISLVTGKKLKVPFDVCVVFATNIDPGELADDAFLRRVRYKLEVKRPSETRYREIFVRTCADKGIPFREDGLTHLLELYRRDNRPINGCEPRNLLESIQSLAAYFERPVELAHDLIDRAYRIYFTRTGTLST